MADSNIVERVKDPDDPRRCQATHSYGQCTIVSMPDNKYCAAHLAGSKQLAEKKRARMYQLERYQARVERFADHEGVKTLRDEIGITRMMLEQIVNRCSTDHDLMMNCNRIADLVMKIEKLVVSCHRLEQSTGALIDKPKLINLASQFIEIVNQEVNNADVVERIADRFLEAIKDETSKPES